MKATAPSQVTIIGAGVVGMSTASFLQRSGFKVTVVDRLPPGEGCSFGNAGGIAFAEIMPSIHPRILTKIPGWLFDPLGPLTIRWRHLPKALPWFLAAGRNALPGQVKQIVEARTSLGLRAVGDLETLLQGANVPELLVKQDTLRVYDNEAQFRAEAEERRIKEAHGYAMTRLTASEARELEPSLSNRIHCGAFHGGWYFITNPGRLVKALAETFVRNGGTLLADDVVQLDVREGRVTSMTLASGRRQEVERLVICAGAYSHLLCRQLGDRVLLEAERGYHLVLPDPGVSLSRSLTYARIPAAATPMEMGLRLAGTDEFAGLHAPPNWRRADQLWHVFKRILPGLASPDSRATRWMGRRPGTPDSLPVIGPAKHVSNVWYGFGHSHMGLTWAPTTGRLIAEMLSGSKSNIDLTPFDAGRFK